jgi:hypothetical protein
MNEWIKYSLFSTKQKSFLILFFLTTPQNNSQETCNLQIGWFWLSHYDWGSLKGLNKVKGEQYTQ